MKKIFLMMAAGAAALGFSSCSETWDGNPVLTTHDGVKEAEFLNIPVLQDEYIMLTDETRSGTFQLTCSQPDYGYAAVATYKVQVSLTGEFKDEVKDAATGEVVQKKTYEEITQGFYDCSNINPLNHDMAGAIEKLQGITKLDQVHDGYMPVYIRLRSFVAQDEENTQYVSNVVKYNHVGANYLAVWVEGEPVNLYIRGGMNDWGAPAEWQFHTGAEENTWVIENATILANVSIKVSTADWSAPNLGGNAGENDDSQMIDANEEVAMTLGDNPGHLRLKEDFTGKIVLRLDQGVYYITFDSTAAE